MKKMAILGLCVLGIAGCDVFTPTDYSEPKTHIYFAFDSADITRESDDVLYHQSMYMKLHPDKNIVMEGNCDERGTTEYNLALGALRAANAARVLVQNQIGRERIKTISYGKERPQAFGHNEDAWRKNRNVTMRFNPKKQTPSEPVFYVDSSDYDVVTRTKKI